MHEGSLDVKIANLNQNKKPLLDSWIILDNPLGPRQNHLKQFVEIKSSFVKLF